MPTEESLDPEDWESLRKLAHQMIDDAIDYTRDVRERPVWQAMPPETRESYSGKLPTEPTDLSEVYAHLSHHMMPYPMGNIHPRFWMWYMGSSNFTGALGDFLAAILGSNLGGGNHAASLIDGQVVDWCKEMVGYPNSASGTLVSGGSMANLLALTIARNRMAGNEVRELGLRGKSQTLRFYCSDQIHACHQSAMETLGLGNQALHRIPSAADCTMDMQALELAIAQDRAAGLIPACIIATAGTVNTGAIDDLNAIAALCKKEHLLFHVDGCIGALLSIAPDNHHKVNGLKLADTIALDPHKWLHAPFEVGCLLVQSHSAHRNTFTLSAEYLQELERGVAAAPMLHEYGLQTSRGFRALKVWMALKQHGIAKFGRLIDQNIAQAHYLTSLINNSTSLELISPTTINIVCYRFDPSRSQIYLSKYNSSAVSPATTQEINQEIMLQLQENGIAAISDTTVKGQYCLRVAINNHRTKTCDLDILVKESNRLGNEICQGYF